MNTTYENPSWLTIPFELAKSLGGDVNSGANVWILKKRNHNELQAQYEPVVHQLGCYQHRDL